METNHSLRLISSYKLILEQTEFLPVVMSEGWGPVMPSLGKYVALARISFSMEGNSKNHVSLEDLLTSRKTTVKETLDLLEKELQGLQGWKGEARMAKFSFFSETEITKTLRLLENRSPVFLSGFSDADLLVFSKKPLFIKLDSVKGGTSSYTDRQIEYPDAVEHQGDMVDSVSNLGRPVVREYQVRGTPGHPTKFSPQKASGGLNGKRLWFILGCDCVSIGSSYRPRNGGGGLA